MIKIGITGEMGSGKSFCSRLFGQLGVPVFYSDDIARTIINTNKELKEEIKKEFGNVYGDNGIIDPVLIRSIVFIKGSEHKLKILNELVHPYVFQEYNNFCLEHVNKPYTLMESAILYETGSDKFVDKVIYVDTDEDLRIKRTFDRSGFTKEEYQQRMKDQLPNKESLSDYVISNNECDDVNKQIIELDKLIYSI
jgi:dephospho-CoA kinase